MMPGCVLILQSDLESAQAFSAFFHKRGDEFCATTNISEAKKYLIENQTWLAIVDFHLPGTEWLDFIKIIRKDYPDTEVILTNKYPDLHKEFQAKEQGVNVFLRAPFTDPWIERALQKLVEGEEAEGETVTGKQPIPAVRIPIRMKITLPYILLAILFTLTGAYLVSRYVVDSIHERFVNQLIDAGRLSSDWMVQEENRLLKTLRQLTYTEGMPEAIINQDATTLRNLILPLMTNQNEEAVEILDQQGMIMLSLRRDPGQALESYQASQGGADFAQIPFVQAIRTGQIDQGRDKYAGLVNRTEKPDFYIGGPVMDSSGHQVGAILVGKSLDTIVRQCRESTLAQVTLYSQTGSILASTLLVEQDIQPVSVNVATEVLSRQDSQSMLREFPSGTQMQINPAIRRLAIASASYSELLGPWEVRGGEDLGLLGTSLSENNISQPTLVTRMQAFLIVALIFLGVILTGMILASQVTRPLTQIAAAARMIAQGNLEVRVPAKGNDEVAVLGHAFNSMISGLQEGHIYRDLLGRAVSPEVRETLRVSFASGDLRLEGQNTTASVLMSDIRGFTRLAEKEDPTVVLNWLNEYFSEIVPVITKYGGVVDKFEGDAMLAFFGILPRPLPPEESAFDACQAAVELLGVIDQINERRSQRGEEPLTTGIGINTGRLTAGGLGTADRLNYTIIGDTVNATQRIQVITRRFGESSVVINETTLSVLRGRRGDFRFEPLGEQHISGRQEQLWLYRLLPMHHQRGQD